MTTRALSLVALLAPTVAGAQNLAIPSVEADPAILLGCLASGKSTGTCLGAMTLDCTAENEIGNENLEERLCVDEELGVWRDLVRQAEGRVQFRIGQTPQSERPALSGNPGRLAQETGRAWQDWVQKQCRLERVAAGHSDRRAIIEDTCLRNLTAARYRRLLALDAILGGN